MNHINKSMIYPSLSLRRSAVVIFVSIIVIITSGAILADVVTSRDPVLQDVTNRLAPPGEEFIFGSDNFGRDVFSRVVYGARSSLFISIVSVTIGTSIGAVVGTVTAYRGGILDLVSQRLMDTLLGFPSLVLAVILVVTLRPSVSTITIAIAVALIPQIVRLSRARTLSLKEENFVVAARGIGAPSWQVIFRHVLPHSLGPIVSYSFGYVSVALVAESALSFLGLGVPPPLPSWGGMIQEGRIFFEVAPWLIIFPGLTLALTAVSFAILGDLLRDIFDPRERTVHIRNPKQ
ncbi:MAG: ABC transporter permease [Nitrososphaerales archaeon]